MNPRITWSANNASEQVVKYEVWRQINPGGDNVKVGETDGNTTTFDDVSAQQGLQYKYFVKAVNFSGTSANSALVLTAPIPSAPTGVAVTIVP